MLSSPDARLESKLMTALRTTTSEHETAALGTGTNEEAVRADTLDLGGLIGTLGCHDESLPSVNSFKKRCRAPGAKPSKYEAGTMPVGFPRPYASHFQRSSSDTQTCENSILHSISYGSVNTKRAENERFFIKTTGSLVFARLILLFHTGFTQPVVDNAGICFKNNLGHHLVKRLLQAKISQFRKK